MYDSAPGGRHRWAWKKKGLERSFNGVETDGRHTKAGENAVPGQAKVVRLPRDWIGPREDLVPFGPRAHTEPETGAGSPPPAAEDFWGERSDALHAPAEGWSDVAPARRMRFTRRHAMAAGATGLAIAAATIVAVSGLGVNGQPHRVLGGSKLSVAAVFSSGVSRILNLGLSHIDIRASHPRARGFARARPRPVHRPAHPELAVQRNAPAVSVRPVSSYSPPPEPARWASSTDTGNSPAPTSNSPAPARAASSSGATVSPTGESGALGPIQSPNG